MGGYHLFSLNGLSPSFQSRLAVVVHYRTDNLEMLTGIKHVHCHTGRQKGMPFLGIM